MFSLRYLAVLRAELGEQDACRLPVLFSKYGLFRFCVIPDQKGDSRPLKSGSFSPKIIYSCHCLKTSHPNAILNTTPSYH